MYCFTCDNLPRTGTIDIIGSKLIWKHIHNIMVKPAYGLCKKIMIILS